MSFRRAILTHGGASSNSIDSDGPKAAAALGMELMSKNKFALSAVINAVKVLEDDPRFNAGIGSQLRADEKTIQIDAACMTSKGKFGAVACVEGVQNPIELAHEILLHSPHFLLTGQGANLFAKEHGIELNPLPAFERQRTLSNDSACDTVGAVAFDGETFSVALSSGGIVNSHWQSG